MTATAALAGLVLAATLEIALRLVLGLGNPILISPDRACGYIIKPEQNTYRFFVHSRINRYGMRSDEIPANRDPHALRIMFVGDSMTYGTTPVDQSQIFTQLVHRDLPAIVHRPVEVLNASANAWAPDNEVAYVRSRGIFQSDAVILVLNSGDLTQPRSTMAQVAGDLALTRPPLALDEVRSHLESSAFQRLFHHSGKIDAGDSADAGAVDVVRQNLSELSDLENFVSAEHARLIVVYLPFRKDIPEVSAPYLAILRKWAEIRQVPVLDMTPVEAQHSSREINVAGVHLNALGNLLIARALEQQLPAVLSRGAAPPTGPAPNSRPADLHPASL